MRTAVHVPPSSLIRWSGGEVDPTDGQTRELGDQLLASLGFDVFSHLDAAHQFPRAASLRKVADLHVL